jgi:hypothetical protein
VIGIEWFTLVDQATTGRWFSQYNGESYNTGLLSVADRPWKDMLAEMMMTITRSTAGQAGPVCVGRCAVSSEVDSISTRRLRMFGFDRHAWLIVN